MLRVLSDYVGIGVIGLVAAKFVMTFLQVEAFDPASIFTLVSEGTTLAVVIWLTIRHEGRIDTRDNRWFDRLAEQGRQIDMNTATMRETHDLIERVYDELRSIRRSGD